MHSRQTFNETEYFYSFFFPGGTINAVTNEPLTEEKCRTMIRVAQVFGLIYTRFLDLQKAETSVREAQMESALERVRAKALAMQQPEELNDVTQTFRQEMQSLNKDELATCLIYIYNPTTVKSKCWFALKDEGTPDNKNLCDEFEIGLNDTWVGNEMLAFYESENKETSIVITGENHQEWINYCKSKCATFAANYGKGSHETYHLYKFSNGAICIPSVGVVSEESWDLLKRVASVFSLAYSRFKDLTKARIDLQNLKEEKSRAENALAELKAAQGQLIHSEKMASLGELAAGIAHEIQNPLNFVNNFSEVNKELLTEIIDEIDKGNLSEVKTIANDIIKNESKILFHGKRADSIVKGMLQHSRNSAGVKEPTDINALSDEYLRLTYHGLRAKDKVFNAALQTDFDENIKTIHIIPQDFGRVLLNLFSNAFYAVTEKKKQDPENYEPTVSVTTKKIDDKVVISVKDNGHGIPQKVLDKIFQPFFTTKPTGQGTGLGLSLSYDIIKAHGGEIKVETKEGEGSEFIVIL